MFIFLFPFFYSLTQCPTAFGPMRGCQTRNIDCEEFLPNDYGWPGTIVNDSACEELGIRRPHSVRSCQGFICEFGAWVVGRSEVSVCMTPDVILED